MKTKKSLIALVAVIILAFFACSCEKETIPQVNAPDQIMTRAMFANNN